MAKNSLLDYSTSPDSNTDIGGINIQGTAPVNNFDNAFRTLMSQMRQDIDYKKIYAAKTGSYTALSDDNNALLTFSSTYTLSLTAAATLGANWHITVRADGGIVTVDPNGSELINGAATLAIPAGATADIICSGTAFFASIYFNSVSDARTVIGMPKSAGGLGQWLRVYADQNTNLVVPSGGSWAIFYLRRNKSTNGITATDANVYAGGSNVLSLGSGEDCSMLAWRIA